MRRKILVIDDEETIRKFLRIQLGKHGYEVKEAADGNQAIEQLKKDRFDLIICDIVMPKMDGWQVIQEVRSHSVTKDLPVILLTARSEDENMFKGYAAGANYYITKPFTTSQVLFAMNLILEKKTSVAK